MKNFLKSILAIFSTIGILVSIVVVWEKIIKPLFFSDIPPTTTSPSPTISAPVSPPSVSEVSLEERFSSGERRIFRDKTNNEADQGIEAFEKGKYSEAKDLFEQAIKNDPTDPEVQIYFNNAQARISGNPFILAVVVPADEKRPSAEEILRGVADAQAKFNQVGRNNRLLEIVIVNDDNDKKIAPLVAEKIADDSSIVGVIGHNSSSASKEALPVYEKAGIAMISSTSTGTQLSGNVFFRTVPSNAVAGRVLAIDARNNDITRVAIFYDSSSTYSVSFQNAFSQQFQQLGQAESIDITQDNFNPKEEIKKLQGQVDAIVLLPDTAKESLSIALKLAQANHQQKSPLKLFGGDTLYTPATLTSDGKAIEGLIIAVPWFAKPSYTYTDQTKKRWGGQVSWRTATSYDATQAFINSFLEQATRTSILTQLRQISLSPQETSGETLQFSSKGDRTTEPILVQVVKGGENRPPGSDYSFQVK